MAVKRETQVLIAGAVVISPLICVLGLRQESALGPIGIHAAAKKGLGTDERCYSEATEAQYTSSSRAQGKTSLCHLAFSTVSGLDKDDFNDGYIVATRILVYQLLHTPKTRTSKLIDVDGSGSERLVIVPPIEFLYSSSD